MNIFWALLMGLTQGLTEFFPVSSSAHLTLLPWIFKYTDPGLSFDIALHTGTLMAIILLLRTDFEAMAKALFAKKASLEKKLILFLLITSIPGALFGYFLEDRAQTVFRNPVLIASVLLVFGLIMWATDKYSPSTGKMNDLSVMKSFLIGLSQAMAIIPGVSRSGATITAGRALGLTRETAVKYSFLAAVPIILGASMYGLREASTSELLSANWIIGFGAALLSSFWAMRFLLKYVKAHNFNAFIWYRIALAILIILIYFGR
jgi:undecaprenyl-diphosphatase